MSRHRVVAFAALLVLAAPVAWAADMEGRIQSIDAGERSLMLDNGTKIWLPDGFAVDGVKEGAEVKVSYEEKEGKPVATSVEMK
jgi:uncharacterized protein DUF1344